MIRPEIAERTAEQPEHLLDGPDDVNLPTLVSEVPFDLAVNMRAGISGQGAADGRIEVVDRRDQADVSHLRRSSAGSGSRGQPEPELPGRAEQSAAARIDNGVGSGLSLARSGTHCGSQPRRADRAGRIILPADSPFPRAAVSLPRCCISRKLRALPFSDEFYAGAAARVRSNVFGITKSSASLRTAAHPTVI